LPAEDPFRQQKEAEMLDKLYDMGILGMFLLGEGG
jgi:U3 small nucleolar ribonucleoprotein protein IMP3